MLSAGYRTALAMREQAYRWRLLTTGRLPCPVISVGDITLGAAERRRWWRRRRSAFASWSGPAWSAAVTGAIPEESALSPIEKASGLGRARVATSRCCSLIGFPAFPSSWARTASRRARSPCAVRRDGHRAGRWIPARDTPEGSGDPRRLRPGAVGNARLFPRGTLREPLSALGRADFIVLTNPPGTADVAAATATIWRHNARVPVVIGHYQVIGARMMPGARELSPGDLGRPQVPGLRRGSGRLEGLPIR